MGEINYGKPGDQRVTIDNRLAYRWAGKEPLKVGDKVWLPDTGFRMGEWIGEVTSLGSAWDGPCRPVLRRCEQTLDSPSDEEGLQDHRHDIEITEERPINGATSLVYFRLLCGCRINDIRSFSHAMIGQRGWNIRTTTGWGGGSDAGGQRHYYCFVQTRSLTR